MNYGIGNVKEKSKALFTTTTAPTESGDVITLATTDIIESGFKVGDYLAYVDSGNISALYSISAISSGTATLSLVGAFGGGGGGSQLYQHNITLFKTDQQTKLCITIINGISTAYTTVNGVANWLKDKNYINTTKNYNCNGVGYYNSNFKCYYGCCYILNLGVDSIRAFYYVNDGNASFNTWSDNTADLEFTDTVIAL